MNIAIRHLMKLFLPKGPCLLCSNDSKAGPAAGICRKCWRERRKIEGPKCPCCGTPLPRVDGQAEHLCGACLADPPSFEGHVSVYSYSGPARRIVLLYKDKKRYPLARLMGAAVARAVRKRWPDKRWDVIVPVPSPLRRRLVRGFEPAGLMAKEVASRLNVPLASGLELRRTPAPQKELTVAGRRTNVKGAFVAKPQVARGKSVLLIDDVTTTGATIREAAKALKRVGAEVHAATFAMTLRRDLDLYTAEEARGEKGQRSEGVRR